ncbi:MAG TPA: efflux RND transporter periplasmic adaptor subunit [Verrucomicrobiae bacterium]|nr:efflux RND transporter periplasmic adaptor subunit [Verrucomicrobiae bacterium]
MRIKSFLTGLAMGGLALAGCKRGDSNAVSGTIEVDEVRVASRYGGRIEKIYKWEGDALTNGQPLVDLNASELQAERDHAAADLAQAVAGPRKEEIATAKADWEAQVAQSDFAQSDAKRADDLFEHKAMSTADHDAAVMRAASLEKNVAAARSRYDLLLAGTRPEQIDMARAQLAETDAHLAEMKITSPGDCVLEVLNVKTGDVLAPNEPIATLLLTNHLWARVFVPEPWLGKIHVGEQVQAHVDSFPDKAYAGTVEQIAREAEFTPRNVQTVEDRVKQVFGIKVRFDNGEGTLRAGMSVDVSFPDVTK